MDWWGKTSAETQDAGSESKYRTAVLAIYSRRVVAIRQTATLTMRTWIDDSAAWVMEGADAAKQAVVEWIQRAMATLADSGRVARKRARHWLAAHARPVTIVAVATGLTLLMTGLAYVEVHTSWIEAHLFTGYARDLSFQVQPGAAPRIRFPRLGPYDERMGYTLLPPMVEGLKLKGFEIAAQAEQAPAFSNLSRIVFPPYHEKTLAGLTVLDPSGRALYRARYPRRVYPQYGAIPEVVVRSLVFLENRELLEESGDFRNPAVEWDRLAAAVANLTLGRLLGSEHTFGGSTLATQMEKFRHSPLGVTQTWRDKVQQLASASVRSYQDGPTTLAARRRIVTDYVNSVPLGAAPGYGEVIGLADGMWAWFNLDYDDANRLLARADTFQRTNDDEARAYRAALTLLVAQRRPAFYLAGAAGRTALARETDVQIRLLTREGIISPTLGSRAVAVRSDLLTRAPDKPAVSFADHKAANAVRAQLLALLGAPSLYALDRYDLTVRSTVDGATQQALTQRLGRLREPAYAHTLGLDAPKLLGRNDPRAVAYSMILYERTPLANVVRAQVDNLDVPFDLNQGARLELGSTAKIRTLVSYLEVIETLHHTLDGGGSAESARADDPLTRWAVEYHHRHPGHTLRDMLEAAVDRTYPASPRERFFTGGGFQEFRNFDARFNDSLMTVRDALVNSVNLVFIRVMNDLVRYQVHRLPGVTPEMFADPTDPARQQYLEQFVDADSRAWLGRFYRQYREIDAGEIIDSLAAAHRMTPIRLARLFRVVVPGGDVAQLGTLLRGRPDRHESVEQLFARSDPQGLSLSDLGTLTGIHPLELWVATYLSAHPHAAWDELVSKSRAARREAYQWLFAKHDLQGRALDIALEREAFERIHADWRRVGYPYDDLVPSLGTAIGSSGDRPDALSELIGILLDEGVRRPMISVDQVHFAEGTPYETTMRRVAEPGDWVLSPDVAAVARETLIGVVTRGTAKTLNGALRSADDREIVIGGKTGTGQNQFKVFGPGMNLVETRSVSRTATFVFFIGERFYGTITAHVAGPQSEHYEFTSALPVRLFSIVLSDLRPLLSTAPEWSSIPRAAPASPSQATRVLYQGPGD